MKPSPTIVLLAALLALALPAGATEVAPARVAGAGLRAVGKDLGVTARMLPGERRVSPEGRPGLQQDIRTPRAVPGSEGNAGAQMFQVRDEGGAGLGLPASFFAGVKSFAPTKPADGGTAAALTSPVRNAGLQALGGAPVASGVTGEPAQLGLTPLAYSGWETLSAGDRVFVTGDQLLQLQEDGTQPPRLTLASTASPETPLAGLALEAAPVVGADLHEGRLYVVQSQADSWHNDPTVVTRRVIRKVPQPPVQESVTNTVVETVPQPPLVAYVTVTNIIEFPPIPGNPVPQPPQTNIFQRKIFTPQPPLLVAHEVVQIIELPQPPLLVTNTVSVTNWTTVRVPGWLRLSVVEPGTNTLALAGQTTVAIPTNYSGTALVARWPQEGVVVWTERADGGGSYAALPIFRLPVLNSPGFTPTEGGITFIGTDTGFNLGLSPAVIPVFGSSPTWWGAQARLFLTFDVAEAATPQLVATTRLGDAGWSGYSDTFVADGKLFVSHDVTTYTPTAGLGAPGGNGANPVVFLNCWQPGAWETRHFLDVLDFADATNPVVRAPVEFPGSLQGLSHGGRLVYAAGQNPTNTADSTPYLHALAYDGAQASLVASLRRSNQWPQPLRVRPDGGVLLGVPGADTNDVPALETWAVSTAGTFERYVTLPLAAPAEDLQVFGDLLVVPAGGAFQFYDATDSAALRHLGSGVRPAPLWFDWSRADAAPTTGLWLPHAGHGLVHVPIEP